MLFKRRGGAVIGTSIALCLTFGTACSGSDRKAANTKPPNDGAPSISASISMPSSKPQKATRSAGCGRTEKAVRGERTVRTRSNNEPRTYLRRVPPNYRSDVSMPLVVDFHGYLENPELEERFTGLGTFGDAHGFITVSPRGEANGVPQWSLTTPRDFDFVGHLLDEVEAQLCVDTTRVYATGLSNGAMMTSAIVCRYADRFAAVAPVAGIQTPNGCTPSRPVPVVTFHGTDDPYLRYTGGLGPKGLTLPASDGSKQTLAQTGPPPGWDVPAVFPTTQAWARRNGCKDTQPREQRVAADVTLSTYDCPPDADVELYTIKGGGHTFPGSAEMVGLGNLLGRTTTSISADAIIWAFFQAHPFSQ